MSALLSIEDFRLEFATFDGVAKVLDGINLAVAAQETVGIVGETGRLLVLDRDAVISLADELGVFILGVEPPAP